MRSILYCVTFFDGFQVKSVRVTATSKVHAAKEVCRGYSLPPEAIEGIKRIRA